MSKTIEQRFKKLEPIEHVLKRPGRYVGSIKPHTAETWVVREKKMKKETITWNPGLIKLFDEIISNSVDHSKRPEGKHLDTIKVEVDQSTGQISVWDNGGIPVVEHGEHEMYVPTLIFGHLLSGSNFDDDEDSTVTGQNGEGASLTNIFSTEFTVETGDGKKKFRQTWSGNMQVVGKPKISETDKRYTKITYTPDYQRLEESVSTPILSPGNHDKIVKRVHDIAGCNPHLKIYLNGERIQIKTFKDYVGLYVDQFEIDENEHWQIAVSGSDEGFQHVSFVNTTETVQGGTHLYYVWYQIATKLREHFLKKHKVDVKPTDIQNYLHVFINATIVRPRYDSQTKENLITEVKEFKTSWEPSDKFINKIIKSPIIQKVLDWVEAKEKARELAALRALNKEVEKANPRRVEKFSDALESKDRHLCELYLTEGDSARKSVHEARGKNPLIGSFALKGKSLNVTGRDDSKVLDNAELKNIMLITGLKIGEEVKSVNDLRFGKIIIMTDQDLDGFHIASLLQNLFAKYWPELFKLGVIYRMNTPLVVATVKGVEHEFMTDADYENWAKTAPKHDSTRFKGLGKFKTPRFKKLLENRERYLVQITEVKKTDAAALQLAFSGSMADDRKVWLEAVNYFDESFAGE